MTELASLDLPSFAALARARREEFVNAEPFSHVVIDDLLKPEMAEAVRNEFDRPENSWTFLHHYNEHKRIFTAFDQMGPASQAVFTDLRSPAFLSALETLTGFAALLADPELDGGGLHETKPGGFLNLHADFLSHTRQRHWSRALNLILFLNRNWQESYGGGLELWNADVTRCVRRITPSFNRCIIFRVGPKSIHGVPSVQCPEGMSRKSIALYYFVNRETPCALQPTHYVPRPDDSFRTRALMRLDGILLYIYSLLKRYTPLNDSTVSGLLRRLWRDRPPEHGRP
jgi:Rps23 Pro-64 3,4-dihydroxylase Tpa1-like proline 4-hydroxylase